MRMHEMSLAMSILEMAEAEAAASSCKRILAVTVICGQISGVMPDALEMAFAALAAAGGHAGARMHIEPKPLLLRCPDCGASFGGDETDGRVALLQPCPACGCDFGHEVLQGRELVLARVEAE